MAGRALLARLLPALILVCLTIPCRAELAPDPPPSQEAAAEEAGPSKKERWLGDKATRRPARALRVLGRDPELALSLRNLWTGEVLPLLSRDPSQATWDRFLRCHHTNQSTAMDGRLLGLLRQAGRRYQARFIEVISGFRAPKYNLMLRKKGHQVARDSQHTLGHAIDFRLAGVPVQTLRRFVLAQHMGGVGYYPRSQFIHADTGPRRTWTAE